MSAYLAWNDLLLSEFFTPDAAGEEIWLHTTAVELDSFGLHLGGAAGLAEAVVEGAPWLPKMRSSCAEAAQLLVEQRKGPVQPPDYQDPGVANALYAGTRAPTYLPILALWVLASSDDHTGGFYSAVEARLGGTSKFPMDGRVTTAMKLTWEDLAHWSYTVADGRFGIFQTRILGVHRFVGLTRSQGLVGRGDARDLGRLFSEFHLRPGQALTDRIFGGLIERGREAFFLSSGLRSAMRDKDYAEPLRERLQRMLDVWDGRRPHASTTNAANNAAQGALNALSSDLVSLLLSQSDEHERWDIRWQVPAPVDVRDCVIEFETGKVLAILNRAEAAFLTRADSDDAPVCFDALSRSAAASVDVKILVDDEIGSGSGDASRSAKILAASRRILCWNTPDPRYGQFLIERDIPLYGPFYLLCSPPERERTKAWLQAEGVTFSPVSSTGLPHGWWFVCITRAESLRSDQRQHVADLQPAGELPRARVRFVGGRPLLRGGARLYPAYDLPLIDIEAPEGADLRATGLQLEEARPTANPLGTPSSRRFLIRTVDANRHVFQLKVVLAGAVIADAKLRVASGEAEGHGSGRAFSLGRLGQTLFEDTGLRGTVVGTGQPAAHQDLLEINISDIESDDDVAPAQSVAAKLLDTLASQGSISFASARDQILRLDEQAEPVPLLLELRARGFLEIQTNDKGHLVRLHRVPPTVYELPVAAESLAIAAVAGTLTFGQWTALQTEPSLFVIAHHQQTGYMPGFRLLSSTIDEIEAASKKHGFLFVRGAPHSIAEWSMSVDDAQSTFATTGWEHFSAELAQLQHLTAKSARLMPVGTGQMMMSPCIGAQLFRFDDPQTSALQLYVLGVRREGACRYSHIHDSRWGVWLSMLAFARMLKDQHSNSLATPWPFPYNPRTRDFWLPARMRPPVVLERALTLCSGSAAEVVRLKRQDGTSTALVLANALGTTVGRVSNVYEHMVPGLWLRFGFVPPNLAECVANRLGGKLDSVLG